jgi:hypothetical protein
MGAAVQPQTTSQTSFLQDAVDVFNVLHEPTTVFNKIKERARILAPWIVLSVSLIVVSYLTRPYQAAAFEAFKSTLSAEQATRMVNRGQGGAAGLLLIPAFLLVGLAIGAGLLWVGVSLTGTQARFKTLLSVLAYSSITYILFSIVAIIVLTVRGKQAITGFADLRAPLGLDLLTPSAGLFLGTFLNGINPFSVWGVWLTGTGVSITHGTSRNTAIAVTAVVYVLCLLLMAAPTLLLGLATRQ